MTCEVMAVEHISVQANGMYQSMRRGYADIVRLGLSMLRIGTIGFGGGNALIPVIEKEVVENGKLVTKREYDETLSRPASRRAHCPSRLRPASASASAVLRACSWRPR